MRPRSTIALEERERRSDALQRFEKERRGEDDDDPLSELRRRGTEAGTEIA